MLVSRYYNMVKHFYTNNVARGHKPPREVLIFFARLDVAAGVIVDEYYRIGLRGYRGPKAFARVHDARIQRADRNGVYLDDLILGVEQENLEMFPVQRLHLRPHEPGDVSSCLYHGIFKAVFRRQSLAQLECSSDLHGFDESYPVVCLEFFDVGPRHRPERAVFAQDRFGQLDRVQVAGARSEKDGEQLGGLE